MKLGMPLSSCRQSRQTRVQGVFYHFKKLFRCFDSFFGSRKLLGILVDCFFAFLHFYRLFSWYFWRFLAQWLLVAVLLAFLLIQAGMNEIRTRWKRSSKEWDSTYDATRFPLPFPEAWTTLTGPKLRTSTHNATMTDRRIAPAAHPRRE